MDTSGLFKITHGLYITGSRDDNNKLIGSCIDAVMLVETNPGRVLISLNKKSYTCMNVLKNRLISLSVLPETVPEPLISTFGYNTSKLINKWENLPYHLENNLPVLDGAIASMTLHVLSFQETNNHFVMMCEVESVTNNSELTPLTYYNYKKKKKMRLY